MSVDRRRPQRGAEDRLSRTIACAAKRWKSSLWLSRKRWTRPATTRSPTLSARQIFVMPSPSHQGTSLLPHRTPVGDHGIAREDSACARNARWAGGRNERSQAAFRNARRNARRDRRTASSIRRASTISAASRCSNVREMRMREHRPKVSSWRRRSRPNSPGISAKPMSRS